MYYFFRLKIIVVMPGLRFAIKESFIDIEKCVIFQIVSNLKTREKICETLKSNIFITFFVPAPSNSKNK